MKTITILILTILLALSVMQNRRQRKENAALEQQLHRVRQSYIRHLSKCAFVSRDQIQSINGRRILLYHAQNVNHN